MRDESRNDSIQIRNRQRFACDNLTTKFYGRFGQEMTHDVLSMIIERMVRAPEPILRVNGQEFCITNAILWARERIVGPIPVISRTAGSVVGTNMIFGRKMGKWRGFKQWVNERVFDDLIQCTRQAPGACDVCGTSHDGNYACISGASRSILGA